MLRLGAAAAGGAAPAMSAVAWTSATLAAAWGRGRGAAAPRRARAARRAVAARPCSRSAAAAAVAGEGESESIGGQGEDEASLGASFALLCRRAAAGAAVNGAQDGGPEQLPADWQGWAAGEAFAADLGPVRRALKDYAHVAGGKHVVDGENASDEVPLQLPTGWLGALGSGTVHAFAKDTDWLREHDLDDFYAEYASAAAEALREHYHEFSADGVDAGADGAPMHGDSGDDGESEGAEDEVPTTGSADHSAKPLGMRWTGAGPPRPRGACMNAGWLLNQYVHDEGDGSLLSLRGLLYVLMALSTSPELANSAKGTMGADLHLVADTVTRSVLLVSGDDAASIEDEDDLREALGAARVAATDAAAARLVAVAPGVFKRPPHNHAKAKAMGGSPVWANPPKDTGVRDGDWKCSECNYHNYGSREFCYRCGMGERPAFSGWRDDKGRPWRQEDSRHDVRDGDWECPGCGFNNFASRAVCMQCQTPNPNPRAGGGDKNARFNSKPGDWECPGCGFSNFASRTECKQCGTPAPAGAGEQRRRDGTAYTYNDSNRRDGDWDCEACGFMGNFASRHECFSCGAERPEGVGGASQRSFGRNDRYERNDRIANRRDGDWDCPSCGFEGNFASRHECFSCGAERPEGVGGASQRSFGRNGRYERNDRNANRRDGDWDCPSCGFEGNFASRHECFSCGAAKPGSGWVSGDDDNWSKPSRDRYAASSSSRGDRYGGGGDDWSRPSRDRYDPSARASRYSREGAASSSSRGDRYGGAGDDWSRPSGEYDPSARASRYSREGAASSSSRGDRYGGDRSGSSGGDWDCHDCGFSNFASRSECYRCHAPRGA